MITVNFATATYYYNVTQNIYVNDQSVCPLYNQATTVVPVTTTTTTAPKEMSTTKDDGPYDIYGEATSYVKTGIVS